MKKKFVTLESFPILIWMIIFAVIPIVYVFILSFLTRGSSGNVLFKFTYENYLRIFEPVYLKIFYISILTAAETSIIALIIGYPFAYFLTYINSKYKKIILILTIIPFWTNSLLRTYGWIILLKNDGVINSILMHIGIIEKPLKLLYNYNAVIMGMVYMLLPFMILPIYNSIDKIDRRLIEASRDLGASRIRTFFKITVPLSINGIIGGISLVFIPAIGLFFISDLLGGAKTMLIGNLIQNQMLTSRNWPFGAALSVMLLVLVMLLGFIYKKTEKII